MLTIDALYLPFFNRNWFREKCQNTLLTCVSVFKMCNVIALNSEQKQKMLQYVLPQPIIIISMIIMIIIIIISGSCFFCMKEPTSPLLVLFWVNTVPQVGSNWIEGANWQLLCTCLAGSGAPCQARKQLKATTPSARSPISPPVGSKEDNDYPITW